MKKRPRFAAEPKLKPKDNFNRVVLNTYASYKQIDTTKRCHKGRTALNPFNQDCISCKLEKCELI